MKALALRTLEPLALLGGIALTAYGAWLIAEPAGFIVAGVALFWLGMPD